MGGTGRIFAALPTQLHGKKAQQIVGLEIPLQQGLLLGPHSTYTLRCMCLLLTVTESQQPPLSQACKAMLPSPAEGFSWSLGTCPCVPGFLSWMVNLCQGLQMHCAKHLARCLILRCQISTLHLRKMQTKGVSANLIELAWVMEVETQQMLLSKWELLFKTLWPTRGKATVLT